MLTVTSCGQACDDLKVFLTARISYDFRTCHKPSAYKGSETQLSNFLSKTPAACAYDIVFVDTSAEKNLALCPVQFLQA